MTPGFVTLSARYPCAREFPTSRNGLRKTAEREPNAAGPEPCHVSRSPDHRLDHIPWAISGGLVLLILDRESSVHIQHKGPVWRHVTIDQRCESAKVLDGQALAPTLRAKHLLDHQRVDEHQTYLQQVDGIDGS